MSIWEEMKAAVRRAAERELDLKIGTKPINDIQIVGECYDVHIEGNYLGWFGPKKCDELRALYEATPSRLRRPSEPLQSSVSDVATRVGIAVKKSRELEANLMIGRIAVEQGVMGLRRELEILHAHVLTLEQEQRASA